jgi:hypothetical protein
VTGAQEVLDAIDHVLDDPSVSDDAMRWTPQQEADRQRIVAREHLRRVQATRVPPPLDPERAQEAMRQLGEQWLALVEAFRPMFDAIGQAGAGFAEQIREAQHKVDRTSSPLPPRDSLRDTDPKAYALARLRARGTGPDRQVQHRRPPRNLR